MPGGSGASPARRVGWVGSARSGAGGGGSALRLPSPPALRARGRPRTGEASCRSDLIAARRGRGARGAAETLAVRFAARLFERQRESNFKLVKLFGSRRSDQSAEEGGGKPLPSLTGREIFVRKGRGEGRGADEDLRTPKRCGNAAFRWRANRGGLRGACCRGDAGPIPETPRPERPGSEGARSEGPDSRKVAGWLAAAPVPHGSLLRGVPFAGGLRAEVVEGKRAHLPAPSA